MAISSELQTFLSAWKYPLDDINAAGQHGLTPLMRAALQGNLSAARELLVLGADVHARNHDGNTALWLACVPRNAELVQALIVAGIELDNRNDAGSTTLMYTASSNRPELLKLLLEAGADPQVRNYDDMRAVELASSMACLKLLRHTLDD